MLLFLRTTRHLEYESDALERLTDDFPYISAYWLAFGDGEITWLDGLVLRVVPINKSAFDVAKHLAGALGCFRDWAILGDGADCVEDTGVGTLGRFMERQGESTVGSLYLMAREDDQSHEETAETIRARLGDNCSRVFSFGDGHVLFFLQTEPLSITAQRHMRLLERFEFWTICDENHEPQRSGTSGDALWVWESLYSLRFDASENDDDPGNP